MSWATALIKTYHILLSQFNLGGCRFHPSCSTYAGEAISRRGLMHGGWLAVRRLLRCRPGGGWGLDPVP